MKAYFFLNFMLKQKKNKLFKKAKKQVRKTSNSRKNGRSRKIV
mgnify:CR=1 FL=1